MASLKCQLIDNKVWMATRQEDKLLKIILEKYDLPLLGHNGLSGYPRNAE
jgi:hypothetical protein